MTGELRARATLIGSESDLLDHYVPDAGFSFVHGPTGVVGYETALSVTVAAGADQVGRAGREAQRALARIRTDGDVAPVIVGALPFDGMSPATLVVPRLTLLRRPDGSTWKIVVGDDTSLAPEPPAVHPRAELGVTPIPEPSAYVDAVALARKRIAAGELRKVVLARMLMARADHPFDRRALLARLRAAEPDAYVFAAHGFIGASPELLVSRFGRALRAGPLAGTAARGARDDADVARALVASAKDREEHAIVVEHVRRALTPVCDELSIDEEPSVLRTSKLMHLATEVRGTLPEPAPSALALAALLHPTPAVCGTPTSDAMRTIAELERIDRTLYAGTVGWMDADGDGEWAVALRCAEVQGRIALLFAGAGIVGDSDPEAELAETDAKFRGMLDALGYA